ncbi:HU family DNA-binding protein [Pseudonocardia sp. H11422]|uniref:HU family DNA-binding protein n=1 Tax=Pseudonocardia sp. H11422 TaxID=2835866 RepID=UPI001BDD132D|nr:HU family DNA-binding protein [Pseudonocardia sp. H11422]
MNKTQLVDALAARIGDRRTAASAVDGLLEIIVDTVGSGGSVSLTGFGVFEARARAARVARNPRTGETVDVPATTVPAFRPGAAFRSSVSGNGATARATPVRRARRAAVAAQAAAPALAEAAPEAAAAPKPKAAKGGKRAAKASASFAPEPEAARDKADKAAPAKATGGKGGKGDKAAAAKSEKAKPVKKPAKGKK